MKTNDPILHSLEKLYVAVVCDVLDSLGRRHQALDASLSALTSSHRLVGRAFTVRAHAVDEIPAAPYKLEIEAVDRMVDGDVLVAECGQDRTCGFWGELLTTACLYKGVRGVVMDACTRDVWKIKDLPFPVFGIGRHPADSKGRFDIYELGSPARIGGVEICSGDYMLGDEDGLVCIPKGIAAEVVRLATGKVSGENVARADLAKGVPMGEVFRRYGIL